MCVTFLVTFFFTEKRGFSFSSFLSRSSESTMYRTFLTPPESKSPVFLRFVKLPPRAAAANTAVASSPPPAAGVRPPALGLWLTSLQGAAQPGLEHFRVGAFSETPHTTSYESFGPFSCVPTSSFLDTDDNSGAASRWQDCRLHVWFLAEWGLWRLHVAFLRGHLQGMTWHLHFKLSVVFQWNCIQPSKKPILFINFSFSIVVPLWIF